MEHALPRPDTAWRKAAYAAGAVAVLELAVLLALALPMLGRALADRVETEATERALAPLKAKPAPVKKEKPKALVPRSETSVLVLNGNGVAGAASGLGDRIHGLGYIVAGVGNAPRSDYRRTLVMYRPGREGEAQRLAKELRVRAVAPLDGLSAKELLGAHVAVVLGG